MKKIFWIFLTVVFLASGSLADIIHLKTGRKLEGKIISETHDTVTVQIEGGTVELFKSQIEKIEEKALPIEEYKMRAEVLEEKDAEGHYKLALWCRENGLEKQAEKELRKVIEFEPDHAAARRLLGYERKEGKWVESESENTRLEKEASETVRIVRQFFSSDPRLLGDFVEKLRSFDGMSKKEFEDCAEAIGEWRNYKPYPAGETKTEAGQTGLACRILVPQSYDSSKSYPLILTLHGSAESPGDVINAWRASGALKQISKNFLLALPESEKTNWWEPGMIGKLENLLDGIKNTFNVDTDRIYLSGYSNGAHGAWRFGLIRPDLFAAVMVDSGLPVSAKGDRIDFDILENARNLPFFVIYGEDDPIAPGDRISMVIDKLKEARCPDIIQKGFEGGHRIHAADAWKEAHDWLQGKKRTVYPEKIEFRCGKTEKARAFWLELKGVEESAKVSARIEKDHIEIKAYGMKKLVIFLSDRIIDLDKKVTVRLNNARVFRGNVKRSVATALEASVSRNDRGAIFPARLELELEK